MHSLPLPIAAFVAGLLSFLSPCVLPLVPGYVSLISGASVDDLQSSDRRMLGTVMLHSFTFILGFSFVFIVLGAVATGLGQVLQRVSRCTGPHRGHHHHHLRTASDRIAEDQGLVCRQAAPRCEGQFQRAGLVCGWASPSPSDGRPASVLFWRPSWRWLRSRTRLSKGVLLLAIYSAGLGRTLFADVDRHRPVSVVLRQVPAPSAHRRGGERRAAHRGWRVDFHEQSAVAVWLPGVLESLRSIKAWFVKRNAFVFAVLAVAILGMLAFGKWVDRQRQKRSVRRRWRATFEACRRPISNSFLWTAARSSSRTSAAKPSF